MSSEPTRSEHTPSARSPSGHPPSEKARISLAPEERSAWIMLVLAVIGYPIYLALLFTGPSGTAERGSTAAGPELTDLSFAGPMLWTIGGSVVVSVILHAASGVFTDGEAGGRDERDRQIGRWAELIGQSFVVTGALSGLVLAMLRADVFWIANAIYLCFFLSAILGSIAKIIAYRTGFSATW
ncbi:hypothetical protein GCM10022261_12430 [Brevibacterium daeguense]|uniref:Uncharacterized protein n=1 Tax=Brevibacterium daeguense TaxID=909936 RepID=A0ABP8EIE1_9MICO|nr:hypothetical protein [Brevibacterium daeguense]